MMSSVMMLVITIHFNKYTPTNWRIKTNELVINKQVMHDAFTYIFASENIHHNVYEGQNQVVYISTIYFVSFFFHFYLFLFLINFNDAIEYEHI